MLGQIDLVTLVVGDVRRCAGFYRDVLGFKTAGEEAPFPDDYLEFDHAGVRFALCSRRALADATGHPSLQERRAGQAVELAIRLGDADEVDATFERLIARGVRPVAPPAPMPWGQRTAFIADPEGNLIELFADVPAAAPVPAAEGEGEA
jgi:catechol 2,3-dioxygenase-like lactoylglutathione lyase family enzyme